MTTPMSEVASISSSQRISAAKPKRLSTASSLSILRPSTAPTLDNLTLSHILNGETCHPIAFTDFASFTANKELTSENLLFVLWFRSYRARYDALSLEERAKVPVPSTKLGDRYQPFARLDQERRDTKAESVLKSPTSDLLYKKSEHPFKVCEWAAGDAQRRLNPILQIGKISSNLPASSASQDQPSILRSHLPDVVEYDKVVDLPMREEAIRAFSTFMRKGGSRELGISDELREFTKTCLQRSTAPEVFLPIYEEIYHTLETQSLPHFLSYAKGNVNKPKAMFWYIVGAIDILIGVIIFLILTLLLSDRYFAYRATRLPSTIFVFFGAAQMYSAYRGFCSQVWGRASSQLRPWELDMGDEEDLVGSRSSTPPSAPTSMSQQPSEMVETNRTRRSTIETSRRHTHSVASEIVFTPDGLSKDMTLPAEVHPLTDLSNATGTTGSRLEMDQMEDLPWLNTATLGPIGNGTEKIEVEEAELSEEARQRLAVRRSTIRVPDAALAFPIEAPYTSDQFSSPLSPSSDLATRKHSEISPFDFPLDEHSTAPYHRPSTSSARLFRDKNNNNDIANDNAPPASRRHVPRSPSQIELGVLLETFELGADRHQEPEEKKQKMKMFGPERVVQDSRVKKHYDSIVRDILIVGSVFGVIWIGVCFAVPTYGLV